MFIDLNDKLCQSNEDDMFEQDILNNYSNWILDAKYDHINVNKVSPN